MLMYGERRRCTDKPKGYARGKSSGLARAESAVNLMGHPIEETVGQFMNTDTSGKPQRAAWRCLPRSVFWAASYRFYRRSLPKRSRVPFRVLAHGVGCLVWWFNFLHLPLRLLSAADFNSIPESVARTID